MFPLARGFYKHPRFKGIIFRRTYPELEKEIILRSHEWYPATGAKFNDDKKRWTFPSGAIVQFGHAEYEQDVRKYDTTEYNYMAFDELTSFTEFQYTYLTLSRCRTSVKDLPAIVRSGTNPGNVGHCVPFGDVLTPNGWNSIENLKTGDSIYAVSKNRGLIPTEIAQVHAHDFSGDLWAAESSNLSILCTPEHRIARKISTKDSHSFVLQAVLELPGQAQILRSVFLEGSSPDYFAIPDYFIPYPLYAELMGWFISEGYTIERDKAFAIAQSKEDNRIRIENLLQSCGFKFSKSSSSFTIYSEPWFNYFKQFGKCREKFIPRELLKSSFNARFALFQALVSGDGNKRSRTHGYYYTISKQLADDFCELAVSLGYSTNLGSRQRINRQGLSYDIAFTCNNSYSELLTGQHIYDVNSSVKRKSNVDRIPYNGPVFDIGVPEHHSFVIRQNGSVWVSGNSWVRKRFIEAGPYGSILLDPITKTKRIFVQSLCTDNPHIDPGYVSRLAGLPEAELRAKRDGDWWFFAGQVFDEWREAPLSDEPENACHVIEPFEIPLYWPRILAIDWGFKAMTIALWGAISPDMRLYVYREYSCKEQKISTWATEIGRLNSFDNVPLTDAIICHSAYQNRGDENTIAEKFEQFSEIKVRTSDSNKERVAGLVLFREYIRWRPKPDRKILPKEEYSQERASEILRKLGTTAHQEYLESFRTTPEETNLPKLQVFVTCTELRKCIPLCIYHETKKDEVAEFDGDDPYDAGRYLILAAEEYMRPNPEAKKKQKIDQTIQALKNSQDQTLFYRRMEALEREQKEVFKPIRLARRY